MVQLTTIDSTNVRNASGILRAVNHKLRQNILKLLLDNKSMNVTDIYIKLRLEQAVASQQLAILRQTNVVSTRREGKNILYSLNVRRISNISDFVEKLRDNLPE